MTWREYHESTKHTVESLRRSRHFLDWANMPDPFRHYDGVPVLDLPADCSTFLSWLLFHSAAISATKVAPGSGHRYALRVNPSSGNLHPTEFHFVTRGLKDWPDGAYHYRPSSHMVEQRAIGPVAGFEAHDAPLIFILTSIPWREAWKYRDRAYRYCLLDIGHAWQSLELAAESVGCDVVALGRFDDQAVAASLGLPADEWPMLIVEIRGLEVCALEPVDPDWTGGVPNRLSESVLSYPSIEAVHAATGNSGVAYGDRLPNLPLGLPFSGEVARRRRSALDFVGGDQSISREQLATLIPAGTRLIQLYLYAHRVECLEPGLYRIGPDRELELVKSGDQRVMAAALSLGQDLAGNACVAFSMVADVERATREFGPRGYRYAFFEAGAAGHNLYVAATSLGLGATGIGAFYDDEVHRYLGLTLDQGQVVYHFAVGYPVLDSRVQG